jgi:C1A family cysteine protease
MYIQNRKKSSWFFSAILLSYFSLQTQIIAQNAKGCKLNRKTYMAVEKIPPPSRDAQENLPKKYSLKQYAPEPRNQGDYGTCVGWALAYSARTIQMAKHYDWKNNVLITDNAFSPYFLYEKIKKSDDKFCSEGTDLAAALDTMKKNGVIKFSEYEFTCNGSITNRHEKKASEYRIKNYMRLFDYDSPARHASVKKVLAGGNPVVIGIGVPNSFKKVKGTEIWQLKEPFNSQQADEGHALTVVGYDDEKYGGAFELMNSWGTNWGSSGFVWVSYKDFEQICFQAYTMQAEDNDFFEWKGGLNIELSNGEKMPFVFNGQIFESKEAYFEGTRFKFNIKNYQPTYVYIFGTDISKKIYNYFPNTKNESAYLSSKNQNPTIPFSNQYIEMDNTKGIDKYCILFSQEKLPIEAIIEELKLWKTENFEDNLKKIIKEYSLLLSNEIRFFNQEDAQFEVLSHKSQVVPFFLHIKHN